MSSAFAIGGGEGDAAGVFHEYDAYMAEQRGDTVFSPINDDELKSITGSEIMDAVGSVFSGSQIAEERRQGMRLFYGKPFGNEVQGRSQVVMTEVADTIHWIMPSLMRMFTGGEQMVEYRATSEKDEAGARQATDVINKIFMEECNGFQVLYEGFFTALLENRAFWRVEQQDWIEPKITTYVGLTEREYEQLIGEDEHLEIMAFDERVEIFQGQEIPVVDCTVKIVKNMSKMVIRGIPPEEFMIARREHYLNDDTWFCGERRKLYTSDLIAMGFDPELVKTLPNDEDQEYSLSRIERTNQDQDFPSKLASRRDMASREHWVNDCFIRIDADGDGYAELRNVMVIGDEAQVLMSNDYANFVPYASITAYPIPFKFTGLSVPMIVGDIQRIQSTLMRQTLDNTYLQNHQRHLVLEGAVEVPDLLTARPGGVIRVRTLDAVKPLETNPLTPLVLSVMDRLDGVRETRTGVSAARQGMDASVLKSSATGVSAHMAAAQARVAMIGQIFAETGLKDLFRLMLRTFIQNNNKPLTMKIRGKWEDIDPSSWNIDMNIKVKVGLGVGAAAEQVSYLMATLQLQQEFVKQGANFLVTPQQIFDTTAELSNAMQYSRRDKFFTDPGAEMQWPEPPPDVKLLEHERRKQDDGLRNAIDQMKVMSDATNLANMHEWRMAEIEKDDRLAKLQSETQIQVATIAQRGNADADGSE